MGDSQSVLSFEYVFGPAFKRLHILGSPGLIIFDWLRFDNGGCPVFEPERRSVNIEGLVDVANRAQQSTLNVVDVSWDGWCTLRAVRRL